MGDSAFVCALRGAFAKLSRVPLSGVRVLSAKSSNDETIFKPVSQFNGTCVSPRRLSEPEQQNRRTQTLTPISVEVEVDSIRSALVSSPATAQDSVRSAVEAAFLLNSTLLDSVFSAVTLSACSAQGIAAQGCPNPPSLALTLAIHGSSATRDEVPTSFIPSVVLALAAVSGLLLVVSIVMTVLWLRAGSLQKVQSRAVSSDLTVRHLVPARQDKNQFAVRQLVSQGNASAALTTRHVVSVSSPHTPQSKNHFSVRMVVNPLIDVRGRPK
jgi:hypothetical protein